MSIFFLIVKSLLILFFLVMFLRTSKAAWGVGLLTVTTAILLDSFLTTLGRQEMLEQLGFFFYIITGIIISGAALWSWALIREFVTKSDSFGENNGTRSTNSSRSLEEKDNFADDESPSLITNEIRESLNTEDLLDLVFDLGYQNEVSTFSNTRNEYLLQEVVKIAIKRDQIEALRIAIDRIKNPIPAENLPRITKLNPDSPPIILRHYLLNRFSTEELDGLSQGLGLENQTEAVTLKRQKVRWILSQLYQHNDIGRLIEIIQVTSSEYPDVKD